VRTSLAITPMLPGGLLHPKEPARVCRGLHGLRESRKQYTLHQAGSTPPGRSAGLMTGPEV
jgi:hypothetical protein